MKKLTILSFILATILLAGNAWGQDDLNLNEWLNTDCGAGEEQSAAQKMASQAHNIQLREDLQSALMNGPSDSERQKVRIHAGKNYDRNQAFIEEGNATFFTARQLESLKSVSKSDFVEQEETNYIKRYKDQARLGLELIGQLNSSYGVTMETSPVPAASNVNFSFIIPEDANYKVMLYDISGKFIGQIQEGSARKNRMVKFDYNTSTLSEGLYTYKVVTGNRVYVEKFLIRR